MGLESYFVHIHLDNSATIDIETVLSVVRASGFSVIANEESFIIDESLEWRVSEPIDSRLTFESEGSLSWFYQGLSTLKVISNALHGSYNTRLSHPAIGEFSALAFEQFEMELSQYYQDKYEEFISTFGDVNIKCCASTFYQKLRRKNGFREKISKWFKASKHTNLQ